MASSRETGKMAKVWNRLHQLFPTLVYLRSKLYHLIPVFFAVTFASFLLLNLLPGNIVDALLVDQGDFAADQETRAEIEKELGLDKPVMVRYVIWLGDLVQGDLGRSYVTGSRVFELIAQRMPATLQLLVMAQLFALLLAIPLGVYAAYRQNRLPDRILSTVMFGIVATPIFVLAIVMVFVFAVTLQWLPAVGHTPMFLGFWANIKGFILPMIAVGLTEVPILMRVLRVDMITTLQEDYIALAKAKGMTTRHILFRHAFRPSSFTLVTIVGLQLGRLISGLVIVESIFAIPGIGKLLIDAIDSRDVLVVQGIVAFTAIAYVLINFTVDIIYSLLDPRVRRGTEGARA
ncbi:MAG: ABC transporter permease [Rhodospirillales bacterium]|nr:ABC transporter permease [Rhodospirillales bacterium]